jgi:two-component system response regulator AtoC
VPIHCAAIPETLLESELFGHEKGAFTGAVQRRIGQFESAHGGTVFLDEVSDISPAVQVKLLRVLEQREIVRVGGTQPIALDIRLVAATNKDLAQEVGEGRFREDLYYRLNVVRIRIPSLRQRPADIPPLVHHYLQTLARENNRSPLQISAAALQCLVNYAWPGNIRQLRNVMEQLVVFSRSEVLGIKDLPPPVRESAGELNEDFSESVDNISEGAKMRESSGEKTDELVLDAKMTLDEIERRYILYTLARMKDNRTRAAEKLGISRRTLQRKLKELGADDHGRAKLSQEETE